MITMIQTGEFVGSEGDELHDFLTEDLLNDAKACWRATSRSVDRGETVVWPIEILERHGAYQIWSPEFNRAGLFLDLEDARAFVFQAWEDAVERRD
jgi:hypothetical protein